MAIMHTHHGHPDPNTAAQPSVLELGENVGAAVIYTPSDLNGAEIEIKPSGAGWNGAHTAVRRRPVGGGSSDLFAALFYGLPAGPYDLRLDHDIRSIRISGGQVTEETW